MRVLYITVAITKKTEIPSYFSHAPCLSSVSFFFVFLFFFLFVFLCFFTGLPPQSTKPISTFDIPNTESTNPKSQHRINKPEHRINKPKLRTQNQQTQNPLKSGKPIPNPTQNQPKIHRKKKPKIPKSLCFNHHHHHHLLLWSVKKKKRIKKERQNKEIKKNDEKRDAEMQRLLHHHHHLHLLHHHH